MNNPDSREALSDQALRQLRREMKRTRLLCGISCLCTLCLAAVLVLLFWKARPVLETAARLPALIDQAGPALEQFSRLDIEAANRTLNRLDEALAQVDLPKLSETVSALDAQALNEAISRTGDALEKLDVEEFSRALKNLNDIVASLQEISDRFHSGLGSWFGN